MSGPIKRVKFKPPKSPNRRDKLDDSFDPGQAFWENNDDSDTSPSPKRSKKLENVKIFRQAEALGMANSLPGFTHTMAEQEMQLHLVCFLFLKLKFLCHF